MDRISGIMGVVDFSLWDFPYWDQFSTGIFMAFSATLKSMEIWVGLRRLTWILQLQNSHTIGVQLFDAIANGISMEDDGILRISMVDFMRQDEG